MKTCIKCNEHKEEADYRPTRSGKSMSTVCIGCVRRVKRAEIVVYRAANKSLVKAYSDVYRAANPLVYAKAKEHYYKTHPEVATAERRRHKKRGREELRRDYVVGLLCKAGLPRKVVPDELIELKRQQILNKRLQKQLEKLIGEKNG